MELAAYFAGSLRDFTVALDWWLMSAAQRLVLGTLYKTVHFGQVVTYGELAERSGSTIPARGIGSIMGSNPIPILVPCHRVVAGNGLGGFSGGDGVESKQALLALEGRLPAAPPSPHRRVAPRRGPRHDRMLQDQVGEPKHQLGSW